MANQRLLLSAGIVGMIVTAGLIFTLSAGRSEPEYQGTKLSAWLKAVHTTNGPAAQKAIQRMGTNAVPLLTRELLATDSTFKTWWTAFASRHGLNSLTFTLAWERRERARWGILALGPAAKPAIPALIESFKFGDRVWITGNLFASIGKESIPSLLAASTNENQRIRLSAVKALGAFPEEAPTIIPYLLRSLHDPDERVANQADWSLSSMKRSQP